MPVIVVIPGALRQYADGKSRIVVERSATIAGVLDELGRKYPGIKDRVMTEQTQIREHINIFVGNENIRYTGGLQTPVPDGAEIVILPSISGG
jgi:molybdopterin converting factor small subunit